MDHIDDIDVTPTFSDEVNFILTQYGQRVSKRCPAVDEHPFTRKYNELPLTAAKVFFFNLKKRIVVGFHFHARTKDLLDICDVS